jgi:hypothetical protein
VYAAWQRVVADGAVSSQPLRHHCGYLVGIGFPPSWGGGGAELLTSTSRELTVIT